jgi:hypothetical protein
VSLEAERGKEWWICGWGRSGEGVRIREGIWRREY